MKRLPVTFAMLLAAAAAQAAKPHWADISCGSIIIAEGSDRFQYIYGPSNDDVAMCQAETPTLFSRDVVLKCNKEFSPGITTMRLSVVDNERIILDDELLFAVTEHGPICD